MAMRGEGEAKFQSTTFPHIWEEKPVQLKTKCSKIQHKSSILDCDRPFGARKLQRNGFTPLHWAPYILCSISIEKAN